MSMAGYSMCEGLYRVGDYVYMELSGGREPLTICRLESISKSSGGTVECTISRFLRYRELSASLKMTAAKHLEDVEEDSPVTGFCPSKLSDDQQHLLSHRHLCLTRDNESYEVSLIRGKCDVTLLCEEEDPHYYLDNDHKFFYSLVYDSSQRTLVEESGEIRIGPKFQAEIPDTICKGDPSAAYLDEPPCAAAVQTWEPDRLIDSHIDQFMVLARSVGTFARAMISSRNQPSLCVSAAAASRDVTLFHAMCTLHRSQYSLQSAIFSLVPQGGPLLCRDELENWTTEEVGLFEQSLVKCGKDFFDIQKTNLPWKSTKSLVEYYYMWKTTERYLRVKQQKHNEKNQNTLKQIRISISKNQSAASAPSHAASGNGSSQGNGLGNSSTGGTPVAGPRTVGQTTTGQQRTSQAPVPPVSRHPEIEGRCEGCPATSSIRWYRWNLGTNDGTTFLPLCSHCWDYWLKYAGLKKPTVHESSQSVNRGEYKCPVCDKTFSRKERLSAHQRDFHLPFPCSLKNCSKSFKSKAVLQRHLMTTHGIGEEGVKADNAPSKPFLMRPLSTGIAVRRYITSRQTRHSARHPSSALPQLELPTQSGAFFPAVKRPSMWWKVKNRPVLKVMVETLSSSSSSRSRTVRSPTIAPAYTTHRGANSSVRARSAAVRLARPGGEAPRLMPSSSRASNGDPLPSSPATVAAYVAARQGEDKDSVKTGPGSAAAPASAAAAPTSDQSDSTQAGHGTVAAPKPTKRAADSDPCDSSAPPAKSPKVAS